MLGKVVAVWRHEPAYPFAIGDQPFGDTTRNCVQVMQVDNRLGERNWSRSSRKEIPAENQSAPDLVPNRWSLQNPALHE